MTSADDTLRTLADRRELNDLVARYARAIDRRDYPALRQVFTEDVHMSGYRGDPASVEALYSNQGLEDVIAAIQTLEEFEQVHHVVSQQLVEIDGDRATGETYGTTHFVWHDDGVLTHRTHVCRYQDRYRRESGRWQIEERRLIFDWEYDTPMGESGWVAKHRP
ncbi:MAG: nuclear transport factor 2 family protein [Deltaproteobacteria bacterium]|nr:nuclear transport factor 2 family protein [Deltaproteobacteria bacterium]MBW2421135.1 nuclear transport factor 2 family protein [Deltaproteobacteria bacterium]